MTSHFSDGFDFTNCEDEPIRTPGAIQPHGFVILLEEKSLSVCGFSSNADKFLHTAFEQSSSASQDARPKLPAPLIEALRNKLSQAKGVWPLSFTLEKLQFSVSRRNGRLMLCGEPEDSTATTTVEDLTALVAEVKAARSVDELLSTAVTAVRSITGYDRVMVYRFAEDWHGEVLAESRSSDMTSYLGLHFPATDIPAQARALYLENEIRMIVDVDAGTVPIESLSESPVDTNPDLTDCTLRAVSPIHLQYLRNMGVGASMSISLIRDGRLWGLVACHHREPRYVSMGARLSAKLVGDVLSLCLRLVEDTEIMEQRLRRQIYHNRVVEQCLKSDELVPTISKASQEFLKLFDADGFAIVNQGHVVSTGEAPGDEQLLILANHVGKEMKTGQQSVVAWHRCDTELFAGQGRLAAGVLALAPSPDFDVLCLWTRKEDPLTIEWAGKEEKQPDDPLTPRASFAQWSEQLRGVARKWKPWELEAADELLVALQKLALRQMERLQQLSDNLARSNRDLEDFAFIASHDLQEPLRKIEAFACMVGEELEQQPADMELIHDYLARVSNASVRLRTLVSDLLTYSRVAKMDYGSEECDWKQTIAKCIDLLEQQANYSSYTITMAGEFPVTRSSPVLLRMIFQNLLSNALKYGDDARPNEIKVTGIAPDAVESSDGEGNQAWLVTISDTGMGFDPAKAEDIFMPFLRLKSRTSRPGSGIGLAIVQKAAERLGVLVSATSVPGQGSTFSVNVPVVSESDAG